MTEPVREFGPRSTKLGNKLPQLIDANVGDARPRKLGQAACEDCRDQDWQQAAESYPYSSYYSPPLCALP